MRQIKPFSSFTLVEEVVTKKGIEGTNCANCNGTKGTERKKVDPLDMDAQGGTKPASAAEKERAKKTDLVTMPGSGMPSQKAWCQHPKVNQWVSERMCCALWDAPGTFRSYGKQSI